MKQRNGEATLKLFVSIEEPEQVDRFFAFLSLLHLFTSYPAHEKLVALLMKVSFDTKIKLLREQPSCAAIVHFMDSNV